MSVNDPKVEALRVKFTAMQRRKENEYAQRTGSYNGCARVGYPFRFVFFIGHLERCSRIEARFALHCERAERALAAPLARHFAESILAA